MGVDLYQFIHTHLFNFYCDKFHFSHDQPKAWYIYEISKDIKKRSDEIKLSLILSFFKGLKNSANALRRSPGIKSLLIIGLFFDE